MIQIFFAVLIFIVGISFSIYSFFHEKRNIIFILALGIFSIFSLFYWYASVLVLISFILYKKYDYIQFASLNMFTAVILAWFFLNLFLIKTPFYFHIALISLILLCLLAILGIFESNLKKYLLISNIIQTLFVVSDLSVASLEGIFGPLNTIQIFDYVFAGLAFFLTVGLFSKNKIYVYELEGSYFANRWNDIFATISCLSLAGMPAFNLFVSEWLLFSHSFAITPLITILGIFAALLLTIMYFKIVYYLLTGKEKQKIFPKSITILNGILAFLIILLGVVPWLQLEILNKVTV